MRQKTELTQAFNKSKELIESIYWFKKDQNVSKLPEPETEIKSSKPEIDWNFVLGLFFGIGYLIFTADA